MVVYREEIHLVSLKDDAYFGYTGKEQVQKKNQKCDHDYSGL